MSEEVLLYDIRERNYPNKRGDTFRSLQIFECDICKALTNCVIMGGAPGLAVKIICPHAFACWHHDLEIKVQELKLKYKSQPKIFVEKMTEILGVLRRSGVIIDDILGAPDLGLKNSVSHSFVKSQGKKCLHQHSGFHGVYRLLDFLYP